jgi:hypothetical protein
MYTVTVNPQMLTSVDTSNHEIDIQCGDVGPANDPIMIEILSGTHKFAVGQPASNSSASYTTAGTKVIITVKEGKLNTSAANAGETFRLSW